VNAGHPPLLLWGGGRAPRWLESTGPLVSPVFRSSSWDAPVVLMDEGDHLLLYTDGVSETLAGEHGGPEARFTSAIERASEGGGPLLDAILADIHDQLAGRPQPDDVTLLTATVLAASTPQPGVRGARRL
jgi:serine phosphatase RsbU (regulator of sigma subunit)